LFDALTQNGGSKPYPPPRAFGRSESCRAN
jgi:hypothetical protein